MSIEKKAPKADISDQSCGFVDLHPGLIRGIQGYAWSPKQ